MLAAPWASALQPGAAYWRPPADDAGPPVPERAVENLNDLTPRSWARSTSCSAQFCNMQILNFCANSELCASSEFSSTLQGEDYKHSSTSVIVCAMPQETQSVVSPNEERPKSRPHKIADYACVCGR